MLIFWIIGGVLLNGKRLSIFSLSILDKTYSRYLSITNPLDSSTIRLDEDNVESKVSDERNKKLTDTLKLNKVHLLQRLKN